MHNCTYVIDGDFHLHVRSANVPCAHAHSLSPRCPGWQMPSPWSNACNQTRDDTSDTLDESSLPGTLRHQGCLVCVQPSPTPPVVPSSPVCSPRARVPHHKPINLRSLSCWFLSFKQRLQSTFQDTVQHSVRPQSLNAIPSTGICDGPTSEYRHSAPATKAATTTSIARRASRQVPYAGWLKRRLC